MNTMMLILLMFFGSDVDACLERQGMRAVDVTVDSTGSYMGVTAVNPTPSLSAADDALACAVRHEPGLEEYEVRIARRPEQLSYTEGHYGEEKVYMASVSTEHGYQRRIETDE